MAAVGRGDRERAGVEVRRRREGGHSNSPGHRKHPGLTKERRHS